MFPEHIDTQLPAEQSIPLPHAWPHVPQLAGCDKSVSQPFDAMPSQSANPALHDAMVQLPMVQFDVAWGRLHTLPQLPQLFGSAPVFTSQPFGGRRSQSP